MDQQLLHTPDSHRRSDKRKVPSEPDLISTLHSEEPSQPRTMVVNIMYALGDTDLNLDSMDEFAASPTRNEYREQDKVTKPSGLDIRDVVLQAFGNNTEASQYRSAPTNHTLHSLTQIGTSVSKRMREMLNEGKKLLVSQADYEAVWKTSPCTICRDGGTVSIVGTVMFKGSKADRPRAQHTTPWDAVVVRGPGQPNYAYDVPEYNEQTAASFQPIPYIPHDGKYYRDQSVQVEVNGADPTVLPWRKPRARAVRDLLRSLPGYSERNEYHRGVKAPSEKKGKHAPSHAASWLADVDRDTIGFMHGKKRRKADIEDWPISRHTCWLPNGKPVATAFFARVVNHDQIDPEKTQVYQLDSMPTLQSPSANRGLETVSEVHGNSEITLGNDLPAVDQSVILDSESESSILPFPDVGLPPESWGPPGSVTYPFLQRDTWQRHGEGPSFGMASPHELQTSQQRSGTMFSPSYVTHPGGHMPSQQGNDDNYD